ncbi:MAG: asparaginase [Coriobacteriia bacterium]|nr:asparaginase [Coriobacteriia bacterium]
MKKVLVIATGGTIASAEEGSGLAPALTGEQLVAFVPEVAQMCCVEVSQVMNVDSTNMRPEGWLAIAGEVRRRYDDFDGFVVLHGTDTLAYTAAGLSYLVQGSPKPVVLTGSQLPMGDPGTDGKRNLLDAVLVACEDAAAGVLVTFGGKVISGTAARKVRTRSFEAFDSLNVLDLGRVCDGRVEWADGAEAGDVASGVRFYDALNPRVAVLKLTPGMDALVIDALRPACDALVVEAFGLGGIPEYDGITETLLAWVDAGKTLVMTTQCPYEGADLSVYEVGRAFCDRPGVLMGGSATTEALLAKTMWALAQATDPDGVVDREKLADLFASC